MSKIQRECCNYCMWYGPTKADGTMRKHYRASDEPGRRVQVRALGVCPGSGKAFATFGTEPQVQQCSVILFKLSGGKVRCSKPAGHDKAHAA
jgi:hypothetical protein